MATGPTFDDRYADDPEFARRYDKAMDEADEELAEYFKTRKGKFVFYFFVTPLMLVVLVVATIATAFEKICDRFRAKRHG